MYLSSFIYPLLSAKLKATAKFKATVQLLSASNFKAFVTVQHDNTHYFVDMDVVALRSWKSSFITFTRINNVT